MDYLLTREFPYEHINNGALILRLLRDCKTFEDLCKRFQYASPPDLAMNTAAMQLHKQLRELRELGMITFEEEIVDKKTRLGEISPTELWQKIRVAFGGMSLSEAALLSRHAPGMAVAPVFGRPTPPQDPVDVFVLMSFKTELRKVYEHIKSLGADLGITIQRADDRFSPGPFMQKVWNGICAARLIIADCTENKPNVFYEIGIAHTVGKKVILLTRSMEDIPSDIGHFDPIEYVYDPEGVPLLLDKLRECIKQNLER
jgi:hypothetical protein